MMTVIFVIFVNCERTVLFSVKRDLDPPLPPSKKSMLSLLEIVNKVAPPRCPSHNAFKCTGECGFDDCNTHFMEQDALQEHIQRGREKRISLTSSCFQVFLNSDFVYLMVNDYFFLISQYHHLNTILLFFCNHHNIVIIC